MTLILGMYYNNKKGALIATDSRVTEGCSYKTIDKIEQIEDIIIACAGLVSAREELVENVKLNIESEKNIRKRIQNAQQRLYIEFMSGEEPRLEEEDMPEGFFGFYNNFKHFPKIFRFYNRALISIKDFEAVGQGDTESNNFLKKYYSLDVPKEEAMELAVYSIIEAARNNNGVDDNPQIALIDKEGCKILNYDGNGKFNLNNPEILEIKEKMNALYNHQKKTLDVLFGEDRDKKEKLIDFLRKL